MWGVGVLMALVAAVPSTGYAAMPQSAFAVPGCSVVLNFGIPIRQAHGKPLVRQAIPIV